MPPTAVAAAKDLQFNWEGKDRKGNKLRGKTLAVNEQEVRADLRRQNIVPTKIRKQRSFGSGAKPTPGEMRSSPPARDHARVSTHCGPLQIVGVGHENRRCRS
jgi:type IV pilus assembly protein PilC